MSYLGVVEHIFAHEIVDVNVVLFQLVGDSVQIGEVPVQIGAIGVLPAHQPILLARLK